MFNRKFQHYLDLIVILTHKDLKLRYKSSTLGYLWSIAHPLALALVFVVAFKIIMRIPMENYALFLIAGLFPWQWFQNSITIPTTAFLQNSSIIKKVNFPRNVIPLTLVLQDMLHFIISIPVIVFFMLLYQKSPSWSWLLGIPALLIIQFIFSYGISLAVSSVNLFFRDLERLMQLSVMLLFYFTPILYPETMVPENFRHLIMLNPLTHIMVSWRNLFLHGTINAEMLGTGFVCSLIALGAGWAVYKKLSWKFAEVL